MMLHLTSGIRDDAVHRMIIVIIATAHRHRYKLNISTLINFFEMILLVSVLGVIINNKRKEATVTIVLEQHHSVLCLNVINRMVVNLHLLT